MPSILEARGLHAGYGEVRVLKDVSIRVGQGSITAVIGSNGAGKTTLMRTLTGLLPPQQGIITFANADVTATIQKLLGMSYQQRINNSCISIERADLVLAGCAILDAVRNAFPLPRLRVADRGLREGMLVEMMREDGVLRAC